MSNIARMLITSVCVTLLFAGCSKGKKDDVAPAKVDKPEKLVALYFNAARAGDADKMWALHSKGARIMFTKMMHDMVKDGSDKAIKAEFGEDKKTILAADGLKLLRIMTNSPKAKQRLKKDANKKPPADVKAEISGDTAKITFDQDGAKCRMKAIKQGGTWLLAQTSVACKSASPKK